MISFEKFRKGNYECPICSQHEFNFPASNAPKKKGYRILAFDQASITSGWCVFEENELLNYGKWTSSGTKSTQKISQTKGWVASMIQKWKPDEVIFEDIQLQVYNKNTDTYTDGVIVFKKLAHLQGVLKNYCYEQGIPYQVVPPSTWRNHSAIKGKLRTDQKRNAQLKVKQLFNIDATQDEADAILIGRWAAAQHKQKAIIKF